MDKESLSNVTTNTTNHHPVDKSSRIKPVHILGLLALNPGSPSSCSSFSTPSVAESVRLTDYGPELLLGSEIDAVDNQAPNDTVMNDTESESEIQEISAGADLSVPIQEVCYLLLRDMLSRCENATYYPLF